MSLLLLAGCASIGTASGRGTASLPVFTAAGVDASGELLGQSDSFDRDSAAILVAVPLAGLKPGSTLSYVRYIDGKYLDSRSAKVSGGGRYFIFKFEAKPGKRLVAGRFQCRIYLEGREVGRTEFLVR